MSKERPNFVLFGEGNPPEEQWTTFHLVVPELKIDEKFPIPFTAQEFAAIQKAREAENNQEFKNEGLDGSSAVRDYLAGYKVPWGKELKIRQTALNGNGKQRKGLRGSALFVNQRLEITHLPPNVRQVFQTIHDALEPFLPPTQQPKPPRSRRGR